LGKWVKADEMAGLVAFGIDSQASISHRPDSFGSSFKQIDSESLPSVPMNE
jgi:hypothetical protein